METPLSYSVLCSHGAVPIAEAGNGKNPVKARLKETKLEMSVFLERRSASRELKSSASDRFDNTPIMT